MGSTLYNKAFDVELSHEFYVFTDAPENNEFKVNRELEINPTKECIELMKSGRMRFARTPKGLAVFYQAYVDPNDDQQPLVKVTDGSEFVFSVRVKIDAMPQFFNVSDLGTGYSINNLFLLSGEDTSAPPADISLTKSLVKMLRPPVFTHNFKSDTAYNGDADVIVYYNGIDEVLRVKNVPFNPDTESYSVEIDISGQPKGYYTLVAYESAAIPVTIIHSTNFYNDAELARENTFGLIRIKFNDVDTDLYGSTADPANYLTFNYEFENRSAVWRYYVVVKSVDPNIFFPANHLEILDPTITFTPLNSPGLPDPNYTVNGNKVVVFTASAPSGGDIAFNENVITTIKLWQKGASNKILIDGVQNAQFTGVDSNRLDPSDVNNAYAEIFISF
jgi:hypothetical protein